MEKIAAAVEHWLKSHSLDPDKVEIVLLANDDYKLTEVIAAAKRDVEETGLFNPHVGGGAPLGNLRALKIRGVRISFSSLGPTGSPAAE